MHGKDVNSYLRGRTGKLVGDESGAMAFLMLLTMPVIFIFFALALDAGVWYFDHRIAQNQADAAALAAVQHLPASSTTEASTAVNLGRRTLAAWNTPTWLAATVCTIRSGFASAGNRLAPSRP